MARRQVLTGQGTATTQAFIDEGGGSGGGGLTSLPILQTGLLVGNATQLNFTGSGGAPGVASPSPPAPPMISEVPPMPGNVPAPLVAPPVPPVMKTCGRDRRHACGDGNVDLIHTDGETFRQEAAELFEEIERRSAEHIAKEKALAEAAKTESTDAE